MTTVGRSTGSSERHYAVFLVLYKIIHRRPQNVVLGLWVGFSGLLSRLVSLWKVISHFLPIADTRFRLVFVLF